MRMNDEKRRVEQIHQEQLKNSLNLLQKLALTQVENFGWELQFIRQPLFQEPTAVICSGERDKIGVLELDGRVNLKPNINVREYSYIQSINRTVRSED